ncbi:MAG TPA: hypothetical protein VJI33_02445 [Candidatus Paceibacterota bacterium]
MKFWKNWPYWVRGAIAAFVFALIGPYLVIFLIILEGILPWLGVGLLTGIGAISGWLYGKIKNKKSNSFS